MQFILIITAAVSGWGIRKASAELLKGRKRARARDYQAAQNRRESEKRARREAAWENIRDVRPSEETRIVPITVKAFNR